MRVPADTSIQAVCRPGVLGPHIIHSILSVVKAGWDQASDSPELHSGCGEVMITEILRQSMRGVLRLREPAWERTMIVLPGAESMSRSGLTRPDGITDIPILLTDRFQEHGVHDPHVIIECKRLSGMDARLCRLYILEGIDRFKIGKYGRDHRVGLMVGYLIEGTEEEAVTRINLYLSNHDRNDEMLRKSEVVQASWAWVSEHDRPNVLEQIQLHHAHLRLLK